jgi:carboxymethylenebutenolidase
VIPWPSAQPDLSAIRAKVVGEYAELDGFAGPEATRALESSLREVGVDATLHVHVACQHAFFNDSRPDVFDAAAASVAWGRTLDLFHSAL